MDSKGIEAGAGRWGRRGSVSGLATEHQARRRRGSWRQRVALQIEGFEFSRAASASLYGKSCHQPARTFGMEADDLVGAVLVILECAFHHRGLEVLQVYRFEVDRKSTRLNSSHSQISYAVFCLKKKK